MIRDANESDLPCLAAAMVRLQKAHVEAFSDIDRRFDAGDALSYLSVLLSRPDAIVRIAVHEGAVVGNVVFLIETRPENMFTHSQRYGHITNNPSASQGTSRCSGLWSRCPADPISAHNL